MSDEKNHQEDIPKEAHGYVLDQLRQSDCEQWSVLRKHDHWWTEAHVTMRVMRWGLISLGALALLVLAWVKGGWEAVARVLLG